MLVITIFFSFIVSVGAKFLADQFLTDRIAIIGSFIGLQHATNRGVAFSIQFPGILQNLLITVALIAVCVLALRSATSSLRCIAFGMIIGGAVGNIVDRIPDGLVTDFIQVGTFPIFNVADSCITIGVVLLLVEVVYNHKNSQNLK